MQSSFGGSSPCVVMLCSICSTFLSYLVWPLVVASVVPSSRVCFLMFLRRLVVGLFAPCLKEGTCVCVMLFEC